MCNGFTNVSLSSTSDQLDSGRKGCEGVDGTTRRHRGGRHTDRTGWCMTETGEGGRTKAGVYGASVTAPACDLFTDTIDLASEDIRLIPETVLTAFASVGGSVTVVEVHKL